MALMIGCIWHGLDALQGTRAKPGNHLVLYKIRFIWDYNIVSHEYNTRIVYKVALQVNTYRRLKQRLTCTRFAVRNTT